MEEIVKEIRKARSKKSEQIIKINDDYVSLLKQKCAYLNEMYKEHFDKKCNIVDMDGESNSSIPLIFKGFRCGNERIHFIVHKMKADGTAFKNPISHGVCIEYCKIVFTN